MDNEKKPQVASSVKDESLVEMRRQQIVQAGVRLFKEKGFHRTTTREIANAAGFSIGTLYEYIRAKEDVLYLVCDSIYNEVVAKVSSFSQQGDLEQLTYAIREYYLLINSMSNEFSIMYQETKSLPRESKRYVLEKEIEMLAIFEKILQSCAEKEGWQLSQDDIYIAANQIVIQGQSWAFRKWLLQKKYTIEQYIELQTKLFLQGVMQFGQAQ